ncbi:hypothetical protein [Maricaulis sp. CAU 1757]
MRPLVVLIAAALLGGCFYSEDALIGRFRADFPISEGVYAHRPHHPDGRAFDYDMWSGEIEHRGGFYVSDMADFPHEGVRLRQLDGALYVGMRRDDNHWLYGLLYVHENGRTITYHHPRCADLDSAIRDHWDVTTPIEEESGYCRVDDWDRLKGVLLAYLEARGGDMPIDGVYRRVDDQVIRND